MLIIRVQSNFFFDLLKVTLPEMKYFRKVVLMYATLKKIKLERNFTHNCPKVLSRFSYCLLSINDCQQICNKGQSFISNLRHN